MELWAEIFIILTVAHPVADFVVQNLGKRWHYLASLNPLHYVWDYFFSFHSKWIDTYKDVCTIMVSKDRADGAFRSLNGETISIIRDDKFWVSLGVDQTMHILLNLVWAVIVAYILMHIIP